MSYSLVGGDELDPVAMAKLAAPLQAKADHFNAHFAEQEPNIAAEIAQTPGWRACSVGAVDGTRLIGWLAGEADPDVGRIWWWGPVVAKGPWHDIADAMYARARATAPEALAQEECAGGAANLRLAEFCARHGFVADPASVMLLCDHVVAAPSHQVVDCPVSLRPLLVGLHQQVFPGAHRTGEQLYTDPVNTTVVAIEGDAVAAYAVGQLQPGQLGYIDFVGVAQDYRRRGYGQAVVAGLADALAVKGASSFHLSVRENNAAARGLYRRLGFREQQILVPYRKGFSLA